MTGKPEQVGEELRLLLGAAIAAVEPMLGQLSPPDAPESSCTWCPVCALAALSRGEQHPLLAAISVHGAGLLAMLQDYLDKAAKDKAAQEDAAKGKAATPEAATAGPEDAAAEPAESGGGRRPQPARRPVFQRISVQVADGNGAGPNGAGR